MKTKNMRKKALVASLAMLLVAVLALGGATYAWFSANSAATVSGISLSSTTASSLQFATTNTAETEWLYNLSLNGEQVLTPCSAVNPSGNNALSFYKATASATNTAGGNDTVVSEIQSGSGYYSSGTFYVKAGATGNLVLDTITFNSALAPAIRVGVQVDGNPVRIYAAGSETSPRALNGTALDAGTITYGKLYTDDTLSCTSAVTLSDNTSAICSFTAGGQVKAISITIWLEGNDANCIDDLANISAADLSMSFKLA